jgi:transposase
MSLRPFSTRTWAPKGHTPVLQYSFNWKTLSMVGGITLHKVYFRLFDGSVKSEQVIEFLRDLFRHLRGRVILVWDRLPAHRSGKVREFLWKYPRVRMEYLPAYAPELNPMEYVWCRLKTHELPNVCVEKLDELSCLTRRALRKIRSRPTMIASCWKQSTLPL